MVARDSLCINALLLLGCHHVAALVPRPPHVPLDRDADERHHPEAQARSVADNVRRLVRVAIDLASNDTADVAHRLLHANRD